ncbi:MAG: hypothetical protein KHX13_04890 [Acidaminococcus intestini]|uniref:Uncharacterized protein n=1 Tax=Acidaminococcus intestini TaxID=187327 RepID=A0A943I5C9_9FIRM|nr:hypothetical protein [Acidaminococcus intestini]
MPTNISNAVGTQQQFTPRADSTYQGQYKGISGATFQASGATKALELSQSLARLGDALSGYLVSHEKYRDEMGHIKAERMVNSESPEDILKLNALDAAQQYGYADATANPYFQAYAEKMRGGFAAARMKQEYDLKYSMTPAKSLSEESQRYNEFTSEWRRDNLSGDNAPSNPVAFNDGYDESQLVNVNTLATNWVATRHKEDVIDTTASVKSKLGGLIANSKELLNTNGAMTKAVQSVLNETRLMGVPLEYRINILENFAQELLSTGHMDATRFEQMAKQLVVQTGMDGSKTTMDKLLDMQSYKTVAAHYSAEYHIKKQYDWAEPFVARADFNSALKDYEASSPEDKVWKKQMLSYIKGKVEEKKRQREAMLMSRTKHALGAGGGKTGGTKLISRSDMATLMDTWVNGNDHWNATPITSFKVDEDTFNNEYIYRLNEYIKGGDTDKFYRLLDMPQGKSHMEAVQRNIESMFNLLHQTPDDPDGYKFATNINSLPQLDNLMTMLASDPQRFTARLGTNLGVKATVLNDLFTMYGSDNRDAAIWMFAGYVNAKPEDTKAFGESFSGEDFISQGIEGVTRVNSNGEVTSDLALDRESNQYLTSYAKDLYVAFRCVGNDSVNAWNAVKDVFKNNFYAYHNGFFPKSLVNNMGTEDDALFFIRGMDTGIYSADSDGDRVDVQYNPNTATFMFRSIATGGVSYMSVDQIREAGQEAYKKAVEEYKQAQKNKGSKDTTMDADDYNAQRDAVEYSEGFHPEADDFSLREKVEEFGEFLWSKLTN